MNNNFQIEDGVLIRYSGNETCVRIPDGVNTIQSHVFMPSSSAKVREIIIPASVTEIRSSAFEGWYNRDRIQVEEGNPSYYSENNCLIDKKNKALILACNGSVIPDGVEALLENAFLYCENLGHVAIPNSVTFIDRDVFAISSLQSIVFPKELTELYDGVCRDCDELTQVVLPEKLASLEDYTFFGCPKLENITIPKSVTYIGEYAFDETTNVIIKK